jgi:glycerol-3-phosphate acyltransferase PlsY
MISVLILAGKAVLAYLIGSLSGSLLLGRLRGVDIREQGSGNAGGTNALRTMGVWFALAVILVDIGKGLLAAWLGYLRPPADIFAPTQALVLGLACAIGHVWPVFFGFRGGKGAAVLLAVVCVVFPKGLLLALPIWLAVLGWTGYVGLATVSAALSLPIAVPLLAQPGWRFKLLVFMAAYALLIVYTHRSNLLRVLEGTELRFERARVLARWFGRDAGPGA